MNIKLLFQVFVIAYPLASSALSASPENKSDSVYLSIVSTETETLDFIKKYAELSKTFKKLNVVSSNDCSNLKAGLVLLVSKMSHNQTEIKAALKSAKTHVPDSYLRECKIRPGSLLFNDLPFIQESILNLPEDTISWSFDDAKSEIKKLNNDYSLLLKRIYTGNADDEVEGRQASLYLFKQNSQQQQLMLDQCWDLENTSQLQNRLAFQCMTAMAANTPIHTVYVYDIAQDKMLLEKQYCQKPAFKNTRTLICDEESVNEFGELKLKSINYSL